MLVAGGLLLPAACSKTPGSPSVSFTAPLASQPSNGTGYKFKEQPVTLTITNTVRTAQASVAYSVEVATDAAFANKVFTKDNVAEGSGATTSLTLASLTGGATYYWHWKPVVDGVTGAPSPTQQFTVAPQIIINAPALGDPVSGSTVSDPRPSFTVTNATKVGPAGPITYEFQVSSASSFSPILASATVAEQSTRTSWTPNVDLPAGTIFWRARARDAANGEDSGFSGATTFTLQPFSLKNAIIDNSPQDLANWTEGTKITSVVFTGDAILTDFDRRVGPGQWPESGFGIQYTLGMCLNISGTWHCSAVVQFWGGRDLEASGPPHEIAQNWFYDGRWGAMQGHQPSFGEPVGMFVVQGNVRDNLPQSSLRERSNVVILPFGGQYFAK